MARSPKTNMPMKLVSASLPAASAFWYPMLYMPNSSAGINAMTTMLMMRLESMASWMCAPLFEVVSGTKRNVPKPS